MPGEHIHMVILVKVMKDVQRVQTFDTMFLSNGPGHEWDDRAARLTKGTDPPNTAGQNPWW